MKRCSLILLALSGLVLGSRADAATLYASTAAGAAGELYIINAANGALVQNIGSLDDAGGTNYPITGLAFHPVTGVLYGSTGNKPTATAARLVTINPATAQVTDAPSPTPSTEPSPSASEASTPDPSPSATPEATPEATP